MKLKTIKRFLEEFKSYLYENEDNSLPFKEFFQEFIEERNEDDYTEEITEEIEDRFNLISEKLFNQTDLDELTTYQLHQMLDKYLEIVIWSQVFKNNEK